MKFDELDSKMRVFETVHDVIVLPGINIVARLDGRNFTRLTREVHEFDAPFDIRFRDLMVETTRHLLECGFEAIYAYTESDEISILFHPSITPIDIVLCRCGIEMAGKPARLKGAV